MTLTLYDPALKTTVGVAVESSPGQFQFTDLEATNEVQRFYRVYTATSSGISQP
jgi:hypothetical protein